MTKTIEPTESSEDKPETMEIVDITEMLLVVKYTITDNGKIQPISLIRSRRV